MLSEALEAPSTQDRHRGLQRLGDVSLFIAGFFAQSFARKLIDIDYHIAMGGRAYGTLAVAHSRGPRRVLGAVFAELAQKFQPLVDALNELAESAYRHSDRDILRLYEIWLKTGSRRSYRILERLGVHPSAGARVALAH
jgi:single-stranded DNA-specific DHH superfamily exonuclease